MGKLAIAEWWRFTQAYIYHSTTKMYTVYTRSSLWSIILLSFLEHTDLECITKPTCISGLNLAFAVPLSLFQVTVNGRWDSTSACFSHRNDNFLFVKCGKKYFWTARRKEYILEIDSLCFYASFSLLRTIKKGTIMMNKISYTSRSLLQAYKRPMLEFSKILHYRWSLALQFSVSWIHAFPSSE